MRTLAGAAPAWSLLIMLAACGQAEAPAAPNSNKGISPYLQIASCTTAVDTIRCQAVGHPYNVLPTTDVTNSVTWAAYESTAPQETDTPLSDAAALSAPGVFTVVGVGKIRISVRATFGLANAAHTYAVAPGTLPIPLAPYVTGYVRESDGATPIVDAVVEITQGGVSTGAFAATRTKGDYFLRDIVMNTPVTVKVSKPGYVTEIGVYQGFVDGDTGSPLNTAQFNFRLRRAQ